MAIAKAMSKDPQKRFSTCKEFYEALIATSEPIRVSGSLGSSQIQSLSQSGINPSISAIANAPTMIQPGQPPSGLHASQIMHRLIWVLVIVGLGLISFFLSQILLEKSSPVSQPFANPNFVGSPDPWDDRNLDLPVDIHQACWSVDKNVWDFTSPAWETLTLMQQIRYARAYQNWYADFSRLPVEKQFQVQGISIVMRLIPPGKFWMGSKAEEPGRLGDETLHKVVITKAYWIAKYEITQEQWQSVMQDNPAFFKSAGMQAPVESIEWEPAQVFCQKTGFVLPTEAQWEYACRAGIASMTYLGDFETLGINNAPKLGKIAWYAGNSGVSYPNAYASHLWPQCEISSPYSGTHTVGLKTPNAWGIYDMLGNVGEWCQDWHDIYPEQEQIDPTGPEQGIIRV